MTEFRCEVVRIGAVEKHPNADMLSITKVWGGYPAIFRTGEYVEGDLAAYIPVDAIVPEGDPRWGFLGSHRRIKAKRLRGVFSLGLLTKPEPEWVEGQDVREALRIDKYDPERALDMLGGKAARMGLDAEHPKGLTAQLPVYDLEGLRKYGTLLVPGEDVVLTEKLHGCSFRGMHDGSRLWIGSRTRWLKERYEADGAEVENRSVWWNVARRYDFATKLASIPAIAVYGEVYGHVQDLKYGVPSSEGARFAAFDALDMRDGRYLDHDEFVAMMAALEIPTVPILYRGPWSPEFASMAEGRTTMPGADHVREGIVVKPTKERHDERHGRVILKLPGESYLLRKEAA